MKSIIQDKKECYVCGIPFNLEEHHIMFGKNRTKAEKDGLKVYLCQNHHKGTEGVHGRLGHEIDLRLKRIAEQRWLEYYDKDIEDFIKRYGKNYI